MNPGIKKKLNKVIRAGIYLVLALILLILLIPIPDPVFDTPRSTVLYSSEGNLLSASIADDQQWRFPSSDSIPKKFENAIRIFEDEYYYYHPGVNPVSIFRAAWQNLEAGKVVSGGSTLTMQVIRMAYGNKKRTLFQKVIEIFAAIKLDLFYSKETIIKLYADNAPFGGNIVGITTAAWKYYGRPPYRLSWSEAATLAILPNEPSNIYPGKNQELLISKRNTLLSKLAKKGFMSEEELFLAKEEMIPSEIYNLPDHAYHLLYRSIKEGKTGTNINSTLSSSLQNKVEEIVNQYSSKMASNEIHNAAALVLNIEDGSVLAYVGNSKNTGSHGQHVDIITSRRSSGSLLKPFLYAASLDEGLITPQKLVPDIPLFYNGFAPKNFDKQYRGAVPADEALASSLNVPFVHLLVDYGYEKFHHNLKKIGFRSFDKPASHYGLSIILGGAETTLWEITSAYAGMKRSLDNYYTRPINKGYSNSDFHSNYYDKTDSISQNEIKLKSDGHIKAPSVWFTFNAMKNLNRPDQEAGWEQFNSSQSIAWKTGTSYGFKDGWAIGLTDSFVVGVWIGNADGEGRPGLTGVEAAAPLMFEIFDLLDDQLNLREPFGLSKVVCQKSGMIASENCTEIENKSLPEYLTATKQCDLHQNIKLDQKQEYRVNSSCYEISNMVTKSYFILPPVQAYYYKRFNPNYNSVPPFTEGCNAQDVTQFFDLIYPGKFTKVHIPREQAGNTGQTIFEAAHENADIKVFWHLDDQFLGFTTGEHKMGINTSTGIHLLTLVDENGNEVSQSFEVVN
ncbi:penicillin-binding protein 1C [Mangrovivirga sp. M17]|uniref:peptidoglycan glycosyltransferase n=1 Tax=Mangrovivirga halotolerans TaxID=2993936 RepID=A0ABT3RY38_9BACT|nr:penicillin-binding protein 1C [Mangrovivirga halotolerans]MCX2746050.1 penicillin-binding protein 1C [Mangrovivirga halotolerans]